MVAFLFNGGVARVLECHDESSAYHRAVSLGLGRVLHYPANAVRERGLHPAHVAYLSNGGGPVLTFSRYSGTLPDPAATARDVERWVRANAAAAYPVLTQRSLPPTPNGGSQNTTDCIREWVDGRLDALTVHHVRTRLKGASEGQR